MNALAAAGMHELELRCVQALTLQPLFGTGRTVQPVAEEGMPDVRHMHPNLVRAPGLKTAAHMGVAPIAGDDLPVRDRIAGVFLRDRKSTRLNSSHRL